MKGVPLNDVWADIGNEQTTNRKNICYPTQKPLKLLERIIVTSTNEGDIILDPFCGSGTTLVASSKLNRNWIGIEKNHHGVDIIKKRLEENGIKKFKINSLIRA